MTDDLTTVYLIAEQETDAAKKAGKDPLVHAVDVLADRKAKARRDELLDMSPLGQSALSGKPAEDGNTTPADRRRELLSMTPLGASTLNTTTGA